MTSSLTLRPSFLQETVVTTYVISNQLFKLAPILWWALTSGLTVPPPTSNSAPINIGLLTQMTPRSNEFLENKLKIFFQDWYQPKERSTQAEVIIYGGDVRIIIGKVMEEFSILQEKYNTLTKGPDHLVNDDSPSWHLALTQDMFWCLMSKRTIQ
ncbi:hypothetical protein DSO57_1037176 [Entomophthora muscae]|uniref:Uncharacterized protein n=1 Tax=Entomophthora muscae TaxID=34485 RepID=A0ACC2TLF8_9FUNG|nr:hypothetical protein DSO57_1037176 [Entomophthora muscae]